MISRDIGDVFFTICRARVQQINEQKQAIIQQVMKSKNTRIYFWEVTVLILPITVQNTYIKNKEITTTRLFRAQLDCSLFRDF